MLGIAAVSGKRRLSAKVDWAGIKVSWRRSMTAAAVFVLTSCSAVQVSPEMKFEDFAISPDGSIVAFQFFSGASGLRGLGLYEWQSGKITRIPNPPGKRLGVPSFSPDGKSLAVVIQNLTDRIISDIAVVNLSTMVTTQITHSDRTTFRGKTLPVFQNDARNILYVEGGSGIFSHFKIVNVSNGAEKTILEEKQGFVVAIFRPSFVGPAEIYFGSISPADREMAKSVNELGIPSKTAAMSYDFRLGGKPTLLFPDIEVALKNDYSHEGLISLTASRDGKYVVFLRRKNQHDNENNYFDIYRVYGDGHQEKLTNLNTYLALLSISGDGSTAVFGSSPTNKMHLDLSIFQLGNGQVKTTDLLDRISKMREFVSE